MNLFLSALAISFIILLIFYQLLIYTKLLDNISQVRSETQATIKEIEVIIEKEKKTNAATYAYQQNITPAHLDAYHLSLESDEILNEVIESRNFLQKMKDVISGKEVTKEKLSSSQKRGSYK